MKKIPIITNKIKSSVTYRNIGGKYIVIDRELTRKDIMDTENWACLNFIDRRPDIKDIWTGKRFFYGHLEDNLGYVVCEDELESEIPQMKDMLDGLS